MDLLTINEIATMLKTSEGVAKQIMGDTPYLHLGTGKVMHWPSVVETITRGALGQCGCP